MGSGVNKGQTHRVVFSLLSFALVVYGALVFEKQDFCKFMVVNHLVSYNNFCCCELVYLHTLLSHTFKSMQKCTGSIAK